MNIVIVLFDRITALDAIGPYEVLNRIPGAEVTFVGPQKGVVRTDRRSLGLNVDALFAEAPRADVLVVPGGYGVDALRADPATLEWVRQAHAQATWTTSVCTGALVLGEAGILRGLQATTHWNYMEQLAALGATPVQERVVWQGKVVTAAGVSAGIDMALSLAAKIAGDDVARMIQLSIEYDPQPPFDCGSPAKAPPAMVSTLRQLVAAQRARVMVK